MNRTRTAALLLTLAAAPLGAVDVELLSRVAPGLAADTASGRSTAEAISADGRYVAFASTAVNLTPGEPGPEAGTQVFLYDRATGAVTRVGQGDDFGIGISADGRFVVFMSSARDLVPGQEDTVASTDVFLWDRVTGATELVSRADGTRTKAANGTSFHPVVSADGRFVAFESVASNLVVGVQDPKPAFFSDVYLWDRSTGDVLPVSRSAAEPGRMADSGSGLPSISADGRFVAFISLASDLVAGQRDRNQGADIFLWDRVTRTSLLVSHAASSPLATGNSGNSVSARVSADGGSVAFTSNATNLVPGQKGTGVNVFLWSRVSGQIALVSHKESSPVTGAGGVSLDPGPLLSADGSFVAYGSSAPDLTRNPGDSGQTLDVFLWSRATGKNTRVSRPDAGFTGSTPAGLSADGNWLVYRSTGRRQAPGAVDSNKKPDVFLYERPTGKVTLLSFSASSALRAAAGESTEPLLSANGRWIAYTSDAYDLAVGVRDTNSSPDVVLQSRNGEREIVSLHAEGLASATPEGRSVVQSIDASGRFVLFASSANAGVLVPGARDTNLAEDLFLYDRQLDTIQLVTRSTAGPNVTASTQSGASLLGRISADGHFVAFASNAENLVPGPSQPFIEKIYLWDRTTGQTIRIAGSSVPSYNVAISTDGSTVAFDSSEPRLVPGQEDGPQTLDVFVWDRATGTTTLVSRAAGTTAVAGDELSAQPRLSADGRFVAYTSLAANLVAGSTDERGFNVYLFDRQTGTTTLASRTAASPLARGGGMALDLSGDGRYVLFSSIGPSLVPGQVDPVVTNDLFLYDRISGVTTLVSHAAGSPTTAAGRIDVFEASLSANGRFTAFTSRAPNLVTGQVDEPGTLDVFVFDRETGAIELISRAAGTVATAGALGGAEGAVISADGRRVTFRSNRLDLVPGLSGQTLSSNLFAHDRAAGTTVLVSHSLAGPARMSDGHCGSWPQVLSANGIVVAFTCSSTDLVPGDFNRYQGLTPDAFAAALP